MSETKNVPFFADIYKNVNTILDRRADKGGYAPADKTFAPASFAKSKVDFAYSQKTSFGQKFKISTSHTPGSAVTGKVAVEKLFQDEATGLAFDLAVAKKAGRDTFEFTGTFNKIDNLVVKAFAKVDKAQKIGVSGTYATDLFSATLAVERALDWKLLQKLATDSKTGATKLDFSGLFQYEKFLIGCNGSYGIGSVDAGFKNAEIAGAFKENDLEFALFARFTKGEAKEGVKPSPLENLYAGANAFWALEKDVKFAAELVLKPKGAGPAVDADFGAEMPFNSGKLNVRFGLGSNILGLAYSQKISDGVAVKATSTINFEDTADTGLGLSVTFS